MAEVMLFQELIHLCEMEYTLYFGIFRNNDFGLLDEVRITLDRFDSIEVQNRKYKILNIEFIRGLLSDIKESLDHIS